jgi:phosphoglycerate dehydrogenase-like enzyme
MKIWMNTKTLDGYIDDLEITENTDEADCALLGSKKIEMEKFPKLKGIFRAGVGRDNVPVNEANEKGISVGFPSRETIEIIYDETASFTCASIFRMAYRNVGTISPWIKEPRRALKDMNLLVIGTGNIGGRVSSLMNPFLNVTTYDNIRNSEEELKSLIGRADIITLHIPYIEENYDFIDKEKLSLMKDGSALINTSRGGIVSEDALYEEIKKGRIAAAFDVYWKEPYEGKLKQYHPERFFMTPHVASTCTGFLEGTAKDFMKFLEGMGK